MVVLIEGSKIDILTASSGFNQIMSNSSSCIDLITTKLQTNLVIELGVHSSRLANCHHQITYVKFNL